MQKHDAHLEKLAKSAKDDAEAALLNAQAVINAERPWVIVVMARDVTDRWIFKASNEGRSPAVIVGCFAQYSIQPDPNNLPEPPHYGTALPNTVPLLTPNYGHDQLGPFIDLYVYRFGEVMRNDPQLFDAIQQRKSHLIFWFKIVYTTQLAIEAKLAPYETCYCCEHSPAMTELRIVGPPAYNKYT